MKRSSIILCIFVVLSACDQNFADSQKVVIDGQSFTVAPGSRYAGVWYASPTDRSSVFSALSGIRAANIRAIEAATGCEIIPETIDHIDGISTTAEVQCS